MNDIVERLRSSTHSDPCYPSPHPLCIEAADELERLRAEITRLLANAKQDAGYLAAYHYWCQQHGCAPSSSDLISARAALAEKEK